MAEPLRQPRCFIFGALEVDRLSERPADGDCVIAADRGYDIALSLGIAPDLVVGDFDSRGSAPPGDNVVVLNIRKDDTDLEHAARIALERGYRDFVVYGAVGGALDHTMGNVAVAELIAKSGGRSVFYGDGLALTVICGGEYTLPARERGRVSVISLDGISRGVSIGGLSYELSGADLYRAFTLGVGNLFIGEQADISVTDGTLLIIWETE
jgi:thiamine pyrophosphokinase